MFSLGWFRGGNGGVMPEVPTGRLTLSSGVPITTSDVFVATTVYYTAGGMTLFDGARWLPVITPQLRATVPNTTATGYDVYVAWNGCSPVLQLVAWSNQTTPPTRGSQDGQPTMSGNPQALFVGAFTTTAAASFVASTSGSSTTLTIASTTTPPQIGMPLSGSGITAGTYITAFGTYTSGAGSGTVIMSAAMTVAGSTNVTGASGYTEDSRNNRFISNYYNRVQKIMFRSESTATWTYTTATLRQANASNANQINFFLCDSSFAVSATYFSTRANSTTNISSIVSIGIDSTSASATYATNSYIGATASAINGSTTSIYYDFPGAGAHYLSALEYSYATGTATWNGGTQNMQIAGTTNF